MPIPITRLLPPLRFASILAAGGLALAGRLAAQVPVQVQPGQPLPTKEQAESLMAIPGLADQLRDKIQESGLTPDQIRSRLRAAGYPEELLDQYLAGADTTRMVRPSPRTVDAARALGILSPQEADSLGQKDSLLAVSDSIKAILDSLRLVRADSMRADSLADSLRTLRGEGLKLFGLETFRRTSTRFQPNQAGPVDANYRLGPGDLLVLIITGDVERAHTLEVTREGFILIPQVGQIYAANLTLAQLQDQLYTALGRVYSGVRRTPSARTKFQISIGRLRSIQVFVAGDVVRPGAYQMSSAGTVLTALYAAGGPTANGSFRNVEVRRGGELVDSIDLYEYLLRGINPTDVRLQTGDVVFVPVQHGHTKVAGKVIRPAMYELKPNESLRDAINFAGGFDPSATQVRVTINRILPPESRDGSGRPRVVIAVGADQFAGGQAPGVPMAPGDSVTVFAVSPQVRRFVSVKGNVWVEGDVGYTPGMKLSDAIRLAGGPKPDVYLGRILVTRMQEDSSLTQLRSAFADSTGTLTDDLVLAEQDEVRVFSRSTFRDVPYVAIVGAVRKPGRVPYRAGMTIRDAVLLADGLTEDAYIEEAEIARLARDSLPGVLARTIRVPLDSTYLFARRPAEGAQGSDGSAGPGAGAAEPMLQAYDNVLIMRQPGWELQRSVALGGQVKYPGRYALLSKTERLSDVIERAGGLTSEAYPGGIQFYRSYTANQPTRSDQLPKLLEGQGARTDSGSRAVTERIGIDLPRVLKDPRDGDNIILVGGDSVYIPEFNPVVLVQGAVNSPGAVTYTPGKNLDWYVNAAGGYSTRGDDRRPYVTQPNGAREGVKRRIILSDRVPHPRPGATVFVPTKLVQEQPSNLPGILATTAQVLGALVTIIVVARR